jgi:hypothetical protein
MLKVFIGFPVGSVSAAASAGAVFGVIVSLPSAFLSQRRANAIARLQQADAGKIQPYESFMATSRATVGLG